MKQVERGVTDSCETEINNNTISVSGKRNDFFFFIQVKKFLSEDYNTYVFFFADLSLLVRYRYSVYSLLDVSMRYLLKSIVERSSGIFTVTRYIIITSAKWNVMMLTL